MSTFIKYSVLSGCLLGSLVSTPALGYLLGHIASQGPELLLPLAYGSAGMVITFLVINQIEFWSHPTPDSVPYTLWEQLPGDCWVAIYKKKYRWQDCCQSYVDRRTEVRGGHWPGTRNLSISYINDCTANTIELAKIDPHYSDETYTLACREYALKLDKAFSKKDSHAVVFHTKALRELEDYHNRAFFVNPAKVALVRETSSWHP